MKKEKVIPYQRCPLCNGTGQVPASGYTSSVFDVCDVCKGNKIIPMYVISEVSDRDNLDFLRGFVSGYGGEEPHEEFPDGFNNINQIWDRIDELEKK